MYQQIQRNMNQTFKMANIYYISNKKLYIFLSMQLRVLHFVLHQHICNINMCMHITSVRGHEIMWACGRTYNACLGHMRMSMLQCQ